MHATSLEHADAELHQKNARLALAVARLEELDKIKSNFLATVSHELRTPLTSVIGYSEMLLEGLAGPLNAEQREYVTTVMEKGEQLLGIITGILDISRIEAGGVSLDRQPFDPSETIVSALSTVAPTARRKRLSVEAELPPTLPKVLGDRDKVRQVVVNLLGNAVKFTPEGGRVQVRAEVAPLKRPGTAGPSTEEPRGVRIAVSDSGIGIPDEAMTRIFEPFFQVDNSSTREYGGTGLGLSIVRSFVHAHGGAVWVESRPGTGSTFFVTFPLADADAR
jgi:signal transduction histidine kinase